MCRREGVSAGELVRRAIEVCTSGEVLTEPEEEVASRSALKDIDTQVRSVLTRIDANLSVPRAGRVPGSAARRKVGGIRGQGLTFHSSRFNPGTLEKCFRLFVTSVERSEIACDAISKSMLPIGVPACSRAQRRRA